MAQPRAVHAGRVTTHATMMCPAIPQRTADKRLVAPTPRMAEEMTWVVETGIPIEVSLPTDYALLRTCFGSNALNGSTASSYFLV